MERFVVKRSSVLAKHLLPLSACAAPLTLYREAIFSACEALLTLCREAFFSACEALVALKCLRRTAHALS